MEADREGTRIELLVAYITQFAYDRSISLSPELKAIDALKHFRHRPWYQEALRSEMIALDARLRLLQSQLEQPIQLLARVLD